MKLEVATNWDPALIPELKKYPVKEVFGAMDMTPVGSGRPSFVVAKVTKEQVKDYVELVHSYNLEFNYLLNGACMGNMEFDRERHLKLLEHIEWLNNIGVDWVTVTIPYLIEIIKNQFPDIKVKVSTIAHVNSVQRAKFFEALGVDGITLDFNINRDFNLLEKIRKAVKCELTILVNDACLYQCPFRYYHYNLLAHSSQDFHPLKGFYIDYCIIRCTIAKLSSPAEIIKSRWVRPEDIHLYEEIGIDSFKISGRRMSTKWILNAVRAYSSRRYDGNLFDLLNCITPAVEDEQSPQYRTIMEKTDFLEKEKLLKLSQMFIRAKPYIDNRRLDGFINYFKNQNCLSECENCKYCEKIANEAIKLDKDHVNAFIEALKNLLDELVSSKIFR